MIEPTVEGAYAQFCAWSRTDRPGTTPMSFDEFALYLLGEDRARRR